MGWSSVAAEGSCLVSSARASFSGRRLGRPAGHPKASSFCPSSRHPARSVTVCLPPTPNVHKTFPWPRKEREEATRGVVSDLGEAGWQAVSSTSQSAALYRCWQLTCPRWSISLGTCPCCMGAGIFFTLTLRNEGWWGRVSCALWCQAQAVRWSLQWGLPPPGWGSVRGSQLLVLVSTDRTSQGTHRASARCVLF